MTRRAQTSGLILILAIWIASFFAPAAFDAGASLNGYEAFGLSVVALAMAFKEAFGSYQQRLEALYIGSFWIANAFMIASPFVLRRIRRGKRVVAFLSLMGIWDILTCSYLFYEQLTKHIQFVRLGWWMWEGSLIAMTVLLVLVRESSKHDSAAR